MHPALARRIRLDLYLAAWIPVAVLVSAALAVTATALRVLMPSQ